VIDYKKPLKKEFIINERWHLISLTSIEDIDLNNDGIIAKNTLNEIPVCESDDFYVFKTASNEVTLNSGNLTCDDETEILLNYEIIENTKTLKLPSLIGFKTFSISTLRNVRFLSLIEDSDRKLIQGNLDLVINGEKKDILYVLSNSVK